MEPTVLHLEGGELSGQPAPNTLYNASTVRNFVQNLTAHEPLFMFIHGGLIGHAPALRQARRMHDALGLAGKEHLFVAWETHPFEVLGLDIDRYTRRLAARLSSPQEEAQYGALLKRTVDVIDPNVRRVYIGTGAQVAMHSPGGPPDGGRVTLETLSLREDVDDRVNHDRALKAMTEVAQDPAYATLAADLGLLAPPSNPQGEADLATVALPVRHHDAVADEIHEHAQQLAARHGQGSDPDRSVVVSSFLGPVFGPIAGFAQGLVSVYHIVREMISRSGPSDHGFQANLTEAVLRHVAPLRPVTGLARAIWSGIKGTAESACSTDGGLYALLHKMGQKFPVPPDGVRKRVLLVGHSAGCILLLRLLKAAQELGLHDRVQFEVVLMAPACTIEDFETAVKEGLVPGPLRLFLLDDEVERADAVLSGLVDQGPLAWLQGLTNEVYPHSLLYFVSGLLEARPGTALLGLDRYLETHHQRHAAGPVSFLMDNTVKSLTSAGADVGFTITAKRHGQFASDARMLASLNRLREGLWV